MSRSGRGKRYPNFSAKENNLLIDLVIKHKDLLESDKSDADSWRSKSEAWERITEEFNRKAATRRPAKCLRHKYDNLKKILRRKLAENKNYLEVSDTGALIVDSLPLTSYQKKLVNNIVKVTPELLASWGGLTDFDNGPDYLEKEEGHNSEEFNETASPEHSSSNAIQQSISESFLMSMLDSSSDGDSSDAGVPLKRIKMEKNAIKPPSNDIINTSHERRSALQTCEQKTVPEREERLTRLKTELLELQIAEQKTQMQRSTQIHTYTLKNMEADMRIKSLQEQLLLKQLANYKANGT